MQCVWDLEKVCDLVVFVLPLGWGEGILSCSGTVKMMNMRNGVGKLITRIVM